MMTENEKAHLMHENKLRDIVRLDEKESFLDTFWKVLQSPPIYTYYFNEDGDNQYRSKLRFCFNLPGTIFILCIIVLTVLPIFVDYPIKTITRNTPLLKIETKT